MISRKFYVCFVLLCLAVFSTNLYAATSKKDSLKTALKNATNDSVKVDILNQLYVVTDSVNCAYTALEIAGRVKYKKGMSQALLNIGRSSYFDGDPEISLSFLIKSVKIAEEIGAKRILIGA